MSWFDAIVLGIVQGLTEFLPISSSAHVSIVGQLLGGTDPGSAFTAITQLGTETAVVLYFAKDIGRIIKAWVLSLFGKVPRSDPDARMGWVVILGSLPIVILGVLFQDAIDHSLRNLWITAAMLGGFGIIIGIVDRIARTERTLDQLTLKHGVLYGFAQSLALIPGVSRSGGTIAGGLLMGYTREAAARISFLLAIPAVFGSGLFKLKDVAAEPNPAWGPIIVATIIAFAIGLAVIHWLLKYVSTHDFKVFVIYRVVLAIALMIALGTGALNPLPNG